VVVRGNGQDVAAATCAQATGTDARDNTEQEVSVEGGEQKKWMKIAVQLIK
jgi:hypothetical protein